MLSAILADHPNAHIIVLDPHNEYASAFGERAELFSPHFSKGVGASGPLI
jgi:hypothetical protein